MGRVRRSIPRSRVPLHRLVRANPELLRRWLTVVGLSGVTALLVGRSISSAEAARSRWGDTGPVLVTTSDVDAGVPLGPRTVSLQWPLALIPPDALTELDASATAAVDLDPGVPLTPSVVLGRGVDEEQRVRVAVPLEAGSLRFAEGDRVDLWSTADPTLAGPGSRQAATERVAVGARVATGSSEGHVVVAVTVDEAERVVEALALTTVTPVVVDRGAQGQAEP